MNKVTWIIFGLLSVGVFSLMIIFSRDALDVSKIDAFKTQAASVKNGNIGDHIFGKTDSKVVLIEYADFQCPGCGSQHPITKKLIEKYKNQIKFVFRNFPLTTAHPNAKAAAGAAEAAGLQNKYWEMHDAIFENQSEWENLDVTERTDYFAGLAKDLKLNTTKFKTDMSSDAVSAKIKFDTALGVKSKVGGTPSFFLNGKELDSKIWGNRDKFYAAIDEALNKAGIPLPE